MACLQLKIKIDRNLKILFVSSGNGKKGISPIVRAQGKSLQKKNIEIEYFTIKGKGIRGYYSNIKPLRNLLRENRFDIVHAHFSYSAIAATLAGAKPLVVSLMGSDVNSNIFWKFVLKFFNSFFWKKCIVKSRDMKNKLNIKNVDILPNGVNVELFKPILPNDAKKELKLDVDKKYILFASNPERMVKNYKLFEESFNLIKNNNIESLVLHNIPHDKIPLFLNAAEVVVLTSYWEGSPNVIKEAMACNRPIVSTDVGDVKWLFNGLDGHYLTSYNSLELKEKLLLALKFSENIKHTEGRDRIYSLRLDSNSVADKLVIIYNEIIK